MRHKATSTNTVIRFRRWSRKSYAIFSGLGKQISIGRLRCGIADQALRKNELIIGGIPSLHSEAYSTDLQTQSPEQTDLSAGISELFLLKDLLFVSSSESLCPCTGKITKKLLYSKRVADL